MGDLLSRLAWFAIVTVAISYAAFLFSGSIISAQLSGINNPVVIRDELGPNSHHLYGMVMVPTPCDELFVRTETVSTSTYELLFETWREPSVTCAEEETPRSFRAVLFAPAAGVNFLATLDGTDLPVAVLPTITHQ